MVHNTFIKCQVCGKITRIRLQVGGLPEHPIVVACGECGTSLSGIVKVEQECLGLKCNFNNADVVNDKKADYIVECSGEFPVLKQSVSTDSIDSPIITPFIRAMGKMPSNEAIEKFGETVASIMNTKRQWSFYKRIIDLSKDLDNPYLIQEIRKIFDEKTMPCRTKFEILRAVHMIEIHGLIGPLRPDILTNLDFSSGILKLNFEQLEQLINFLNDNEGYKLCELQAQVYKMMDKFIDVSQALIPVIALQFYKSDSVDYETEGTTTSDFDSIKQFYLDIYESVGNLIIIPVALNNIKYRDNFGRLNTLDCNNTSIADFIKLTKANRYKYCIDSENYTESLKVIVNSKLRNAIGHNDVEYDAITQKIVYIPNPKDRTKKEEKYLLEFENETLKLFQSLLMISEYLYRLREVDLIVKGFVPEREFDGMKL